MAREIKTYDEKIDELNRKLYIKEANYYKQFAELEKYMNRMNAQMDWLYSQLSAMK